ncbi:hypothetical protein [Kineococcus xinjiangensis]|uniref:hypothetical protein n=1 Tax=Kineococcus xinjiangensis TaxID=512762 RepID=UPI001B80CA9A|nr:hypothetical protein [Kineococcus xinjiangensis]
MTIWICAACGIEHPDTPQPPAVCAICSDERAHVPASGQRWTTHAELAAAGQRIDIEQLETDLYALTAEPELAIGQRGLLLRTRGGNLLWEPPGYLDTDTVEELRRLGGVDVVSASHPDLVGASVSYSHAFGGVSVLVASADRAWIRRPDPAACPRHPAHPRRPGPLHLRPPLRGLRRHRLRRRSRRGPFPAPLHLLGRRRHPRRARPLTARPNDSASTLRVRDHRGCRTSPLTDGRMIARVFSQTG